jgi:hypothetical protein
VGNPGLNLRLLPSTSLPQTFVVGPGGCPPSFNIYTFRASGSGNESSPTTCSISRGGVFDSHQDQSVTSTFLSDGEDAKKVYDLSKYQAFSNYGYNLSALMYQSNLSFEFSPTIPPNYSLQIPIAEFNDISYTWLGLLGIDPRSSNYSKNDNFYVEQPSLLTSMKQKGLIPSISWAYTAGSYGREYCFGILETYNNSQTGSRTHGSLVFGGFDSKRFIPNKAKFRFYEDVENPHMVDLTQIDISGAISPGFTSSIKPNITGPLRDTRFPRATMVKIDSNQPYMYLPENVCKSIAKAFQLQFNVTIYRDTVTDQNKVNRRFVIDNQTHKTLMDNEASITLWLASLTEPTQKVDITLSYESLALYNGFPLGTGDRYLPIKTGTNNFFSLGRAFLQEAYLISDYERREFAISQIDWNNAQAGNKTLIAITTNSRLNNLSIAGIVCGVASLLLAMAVLWFCYWKAKIKVNLKRSKDETVDTERGSDANEDTSSTTSTEDRINHVEVSTNTLHEADGTGLRLAVEIDGNAFNELPDATGTLAGFFKEAELDSANEKQVFEMEGSLVNIDLLSKSISPNNNASATGNASRDTNETSTLPISTPLSRTLTRPPSNESTMQAGVSTLNNGRDRIPPLPQIPIESRSPRAVRDRLNGLDVLPASPIPQTPLEFYGSNIPESRWREAQLEAMEQRMLRDRNRPLYR